MVDYKYTKIRPILQRTAIKSVIENELSIAIIRLDPKDYNAVHEFRLPGLRFSQNDKLLSGKFPNFATSNFGDKALMYKEYKQLNLSQTGKEILEYWKENGIFEKSISTRPASNPYIFYEGPPSANGL